MTPVLLLLARFLVSMVACLAILWALCVPLDKVLNRTCPDEHAATFWLTDTKVMLMITPLLLVLIVDLTTHFNDPLDSLRLALIATLGGLLLGLYAIGKRLAQFVVLPKQPGSAP
ncbi:hypothetical protein HNQ50_002456 [Silvimonas terrae]|uniref:Uncharacterized protein n=1 Tax=Silvimonas terrae TaxID=300266 RepID=A0A840RHC7_9NEIS|nr:hypothetical protein [Silvimonas terrae]MBB5191726.1 hypothetical protein [Silvimonas terrae]